MLARGMRNVIDDLIEVIRSCCRRPSASTEACDSGDADSGTVRIRRVRRQIAVSKLTSRLHHRAWGECVDVADGDRLIQILQSGGCRLRVETSRPPRVVAPNGISAVTKRKLIA